jgi:hypothetical protein
MVSKGGGVEHAPKPLPPAALLAAALNGNIRNWLARWRNAGPSAHGLSDTRLIQFSPGHLHFYEQWRYRGRCASWNDPGRR